MTDNIETVDVNLLGGSQYGKTTYLGIAISLMEQRLLLPKSRWGTFFKQKSLSFVVDPAATPEQVEAYRNALGGVISGDKVANRRAREKPSATTKFSEIPVLVKYEDMVLFRLMLQDYPGGYTMDAMNPENTRLIQSRTIQKKYHMAFVPGPAILGEGFYSNEPDELDDVQLRQVNDTIDTICWFIQEYVFDKEDRYLAFNIAFSDLLRGNQYESIVSRMQQRLLKGVKDVDKVIVPKSATFFNFTACPVGSPVSDCSRVLESMATMLACIMHDLLQDKPKGSQGRALKKAYKSLVDYLDGPKGEGGAYNDPNSRKFERSSTGLTFPAVDWRKMRKV